MAIVGSKVVQVSKSTDRFEGTGTFHPVPFARRGRGGSGDYADHTISGLVIDTAGDNQKPNDWWHEIVDE